jgi:hypothetical protein
MQRDINFFTVYRSPLDSKSNGVDPVTLVGVIVIGICVVVIISVFGIFSLFNVGQTLVIKNYNGYLSSASVISAQNTISTVTNKINAVNNYGNAVSEAYNAFHSLPVPDSDLIGNITKAMPADITVGNYSYTSGTVTLQCLSASEQSPEIFAHALKGTAGFENVIYNGFSINDKNQYTFSVTFTVKGASSK